MVHLQFAQFQSWSTKVSSKFNLILVIAILFQTFLIKFPLAANVKCTKFKYYTIVAEK